MERIKAIEDALTIIRRAFDGMCYEGSAYMFLLRVIYRLKQADLEAFSVEFQDAEVAK